ncbi:alkene reductase [Cyclobacterium xiamenense]|uniref:alkene reductase n=1 Tax=Cyclobacterium xiamenense TaxID=1297121 RepID=UPI0035D0C230
MKPISLLTAWSMADLHLRNRILMAPMTRSRADNPEKAPTELHAAYYRQRATAGLIITEGSQISPRAVGYINTPGIHTPAQVEGWRKVTQAVHEEGGRIFIQLWHVGRISHPDFHGGELPLAPSAINPEAKSFTPEGFKETVTPKAMSLEEIRQTVLDFRNGAENAFKAGVDGVEIHASNGYLLHQFFSRTSNVRSDAYGGSIANRARILFEIIDAIKEVLPENRIGVRLNPSLHGLFGMTLDEETIPTFDYIVEKLNDYDLAYLHLSEPFTDVSQLPHAETQIAKRYRPKYQGNLIINGGFDRDKGNRFLEEGLADAVSFGKPFVSNPDLVSRIEKNLPLTEWDQATFYTPGAKGYTDYPSSLEAEKAQTSR